jgi:hypothetical protein
LAFLKKIDKVKKIDSLTNTEAHGLNYTNRTVETGHNDTVSAFFFQLGSERQIAGDVHKIVCFCNIERNRHKAKILRKA